MNSTFTKLLCISRPHIWIYTLGSFLLGVSIAYSQGFALHTTHSDFPLSATFILMYTTLWLTIPANVFLYAMNDACDTATDLYNPKKQGLESRSDKNDAQHLFLYTLLSLFLYIPILFLLDSTLIYLFIIWITLITTYNLQPLRLKALPFLDCLFSLNFPLWGIFGYYLTSSELPSLSAICSISILAIIFHIYTAAGDIEYDKQDNIITTSVYIGTYIRSICVSLAMTVSLLYYTYVQNSEIVFQRVLYIYIFFFIINMFMYKYKENLIKPDVWYTVFIIMHYISGLVFYIYFF